MTGDLVDVEIHALAPGGDAVGSEVARLKAREGATGRTTFVPLAAPGELVRARLVREKARVAWAELVEVLRASSARVRPPCALFGTCGGCQWQHVERSAQLEAKAAHVARALGVPAVPIVAASPEWGYRDRARVHVDVAGVVGFRARRSQALAPLDQPCPLWGDALRAAWRAARARISDAQRPSEVSLQTGRAGQVVLSWRQGRAPELVTAAGHVEEAGAWVDVGEPGSPSLEVPAGAFAQVGARANAVLVETTLEAVGRSPGHVLELYAGSGNFTRHLMARASAVSAAEGDVRAVAAGRRNVPSARWSTHAELLREPRSGPIDLTLVDPPREGLDDLGFGLVAEAAARRLVYVSCDPQTLGRDVVRLGQHGYRLEGAVALDLMPHTYHVEVVARLAKG